jgi:integrase
MGSIRSRGEGGNLFFDFRYEGKRCREQTLLTDTATNRKKLERVLKQIEREIAAGIFDYLSYFPNSKTYIKAELDKNKGGAEKTEESTTPLFKDFCWQWYEENAIRWKESYTKVMLCNLNKYLIPEFGDQAVGSITRASILQFRASLAKVQPEAKTNPLSNDRINHIMTPLRMIFEEATERFEFNTPFRNIKPLKVQTTDVEPFSLEEVQLIISKVRPDFRDYFLIRFFTGMRTGEVDGLQWKYVDIHKRQILIRETVVQGKVSSTKNLGSKRIIEMSAPVIEAFKRLQQNALPNDKFVFTNKVGKPLEHRNVTQRVWYPLLDQLGINRRNPYQTRHSAATLWLAAGESPEWIARQMGHSTTRMLFTIYSRYVPNLTRQDGSAIDRLLASKGFNDDAEI